MECCRQNLKEWLDLEPAKDENVVLSFSLELKRNACNSMWYFEKLIKYIFVFLYQRGLIPLKMLILSNICACPMKGSVFLSASVVVICH